MIWKLMEKNKNHISDELLAAFLDGNVSLEEADLITGKIQDDPQLRELLAISERVDAAMEVYMHERPYIPMAECAALGESNLCDFQCETMILNAYGIEFEEGKLAENARGNRWLRESGTPLFAIGNMLEDKGLAVKRQYDSTIDELETALGAGESIIAVVDGEILDGKSEFTDERRCDYHAVVCRAVNDGSVIIYNPATDEHESAYPVVIFAKAWKEAGNYMVRVKRGTFEYEPRPLKLDDVMIEAELLDLRESIAENAHEVWAAGRKKEGWSYGPERDDQKKLHPDMIAYADLTDSEKQYDRDMAINTIKLVKKLGFDIVPQNKPEYFCPECGAPVSKAHVYCSQCGHKLSNGIFMKK